MIRSSHTDHPADEQPLDPAVAAELDALEAALRGEAIEDEGLAALVRDIRAQAPAMPSELRADLREEVAHGFSRRGRKARRGGDVPKRSVRKRLLYGGGGLVAACGALFVAFVLTAGPNYKSLDLGGSDDSAVSSSAVEAIDPMSNRLSTEQGNAYRAPDAAADSAASGVSPEQQALIDKTLQSQSSAKSGQLAAPSSGSTPATGTRRVERSVDLSVRVKSGKLDDASGQVGGIVRQAGGYIADSSVSLRTRGAGTATYTLKVASSKLDRAIDQLSGLGTVTRQEQASQDITSSFDSAQQRLDDANALRRALLRALAKADTDGEIASLRGRIADNRKTRASLDAQLSRLRQRTNLTTVALTLRAPTGDAASATDDDGRWSIGDAASDALRILGTVAGGLLVAAGALLPFAILAAIWLAIYRVRRKRSREAALDG